MRDLLRRFEEATDAPAAGTVVKVSVGGTRRPVTVVETGFAFAPEGRGAKEVAIAYGIPADRSDEVLLFKRKWDAPAWTLGTPYELGKLRLFIPAHLPEARAQEARLQRGGTAAGAWQQAVG